MFFHVFRDTLYIVSKKCEKTAFFGLFLPDVPKKVWENSVFFTFFETLCTKFAKNVEKQRFLSSFCVVPRKVWGNSVFSRFSRHFKKSSKKCEKHRFLSFLLDVPQKVWENSVFFTSFGTLCQSSQQKRFFCATLCKKCECSFTFFKTLCTKFAEKEKNQRFLCFFCNFRENSVLSRFSRHFVQSSQKMSKISVFWAFSATFPKKCEETVFFHVFRDNLYFLLDVPQKVWENSVFFHVFRNTLYKVRKKCWKTAFFELFLRRSAKSVRKQCFIHFFLRRSAKSVRKQCFSTFFEIICTNSHKKLKNCVFSLFPATFRKKC